MRNCVLLLGSQDAEEAEEETEGGEAEQKLEIAFRLLIDTQGWGGVVLKVLQGVAEVEIAHSGVVLRVRLA